MLAVELDVGGAGALEGAGVAPAEEELVEFEAPPSIPLSSFVADAMAFTIVCISGVTVSAVIWPAAPIEAMEDISVGTAA